MESIQLLLEQEAIKRLKARYFRCFDTKDWEGWFSVFTDDIAMEFDAVIAPKPGEDTRPIRLTGLQMLRDFVPQRNATSRTIHHGHMPEIDILSETEATGVWAMEDYLMHDGATVHSFGHYYETYRKVDGAWRIEKLRLTRLFFSATLTREVFVP